MLILFVLSVIHYFFKVREVKTGLMDHIKAGYILKSAIIGLFAALIAIFALAYQFF